MRYALILCPVLLFASVAVLVLVLFEPLDNVIKSTLLERPFAGGLSYLVMCLSGGLPWLLVVAMRRRVRTILEAADRMEYSMCLNCGYDLRHLPEESACPECGVKYSIEKIQARWKSLVRARKQSDTQNSSIS